MNPFVNQPIINSRQTFINELIPIEPKKIDESLIIDLTKIKRRNVIKNPTKKPIIQQDEKFKSGIKKIYIQHIKQSFNDKGPKPILDPGLIYFTSTLPTLPMTIRGFRYYLKEDEKFIKKEELSIHDIDLNIKKEPPLYNKSSEIEFEEKSIKFIKSCRNIFYNSGMDINKFTIYWIKFLKELNDKLNDKNWSYDDINTDYIKLLKYIEESYEQYFEDRSCNIYKSLTTVFNDLYEICRLNRYVKKHDILECYIDIEISKTILKLYDSIFGYLHYYEKLKRYQTEKLAKEYLKLCINKCHEYLSLFETLFVDIVFNRLYWEQKIEEFKNQPQSKLHRYIHLTTPFKLEPLKSVQSVQPVRLVPIQPMQLMQLMRPIQPIQSMQPIQKIQMAMQPIRTMPIQQQLLQQQFFLL